LRIARGRTQVKKIDIVESLTPWDFAVE